MCMNSFHRFGKPLSCNKLKFKSLVESDYKETVNREFETAKKKFLEILMQMTPGVERRREY